MPLETARLRLEPLDLVHADDLRRIYADPAVAENLFSRAGSRAEFDVVFAHALEFRDSHGMWALVRRADGGVIGRVGFFPFGEQGRPELAFLLSRSAWGRGLATEACACALRFALEKRPWTEVVALVRPTSRAALRVLEKLGFALESSLTLRGEPALLLQASRARLEALGPRRPSPAP